MTASSTPPPDGARGALHVSGGLLARNTLINLVGRVVPLAVAVVAMPYVVRQLGPDRFGLLSLAWMVVGYFALFNLGIGPATTKFVAELLGKAEVEKLPELVWTALISQTCLGVAGGILLVAATPMLVDHLLKIPPDLHGQARMVFLILACALPVDFANGSLSGVLGATQRFDLLNIVSIPSSALTYLLPVIALAAGYGLPAIVLFLVLARIAAFGVVTLFCLRLYPSLGAGVRFNSALVRPLLGFGGWVTVSSICAPVFTYADRLIIGAVLSVGAVAYYTAPFLVASKTTVLAGSMAVTLFPYASYLSTRQASQVGEVSLKGCKYLLLVMTPVFVFFLLFSRQFLTLWLGAAYAERGTVTLQILAAAFFLNSFAMIPYSTVQGLGRPDLKAKLDLVGLPIYVLLCWALTAHLGIQGAALAKLLITVVDCAALFLFAHRIGGLSAGSRTLRHLLRAIGLAGALAFSAAVVEAFHPPLTVLSVTAATLLVAYIMLYSRTAMEEGEARAVIAGLRRFLLTASNGREARA